MASLGQYADTSIHKKIAEPTTKTKKTQKENIPAKTDSLDLSSLNRPTPLPDAASTNIAQEPIALIDMDGLVQIQPDPYRPDPNNGSNNWATMPENAIQARLCFATTRT